MNDRSYVLVDRVLIRPHRKSRATSEWINPPARCRRVVVLCVVGCMQLRGRDYSLFKQTENSLLSGGRRSFARIFVTYTR